MVITDNNALTFFRSAKLGALEQRWASKLAQSNFEIKYRLGKVNPADALSPTPFDPESIPELPVTDVPPEVANLHDMWCEQLTVDSSPCVDAPGDSESVQRADKVEEQDEAASPEPATEVLPRLSMADLQKLQQDQIIGPVTAAWPTKSSVIKERSLRELVRQNPRLFLMDGILYRKQIDQQRDVLEQLVLPSTLRPDVIACLLYTSPSPRDSGISRMPSSA